MPYTENDLSESSDHELISEMEDRGYKVILDDDDVRLSKEEFYADLEKLYLDYAIIGNEFFNKQLKLFFRKYLNRE